MSPLLVIGDKIGFIEVLEEVTQIGNDPKHKYKGVRE